MNRKRPIFSERFTETLIKTAMIDAMAQADNWQSIDECLEFQPEAVKNFARYAEAALRAIRRIEKGEEHIVPSDIN